MSSRYLTNESVKDIEQNTYWLKTNTVFLADMPGSGKTYMILALIGMKTKTIKAEIIIKAEEKYCLTCENGKETVKANLVVLQPGLIYQWCKFADNTRLKYLKLSTKEDLKKFFTEPILQILNPKNINRHEDSIEYERSSKTKLPNGRKPEGSDEAIYSVSKVDTEKIFKTLNEVDVVFLDSSLYREFHKVFKSILWSRLIIDEITSTAMSPIFDEQANFNIFVSATPQELFNSNSSRFATKFVGSHSDLLNYFIIKNEDAFVKKSMSLPFPFVYIINTRLNRVINTFKDMMPEEVIHLANAGNIYEAIVKLNCGMHTEDGIYKILTDKIVIDLRNLKKRYKYEKSLEAHDDKEKEAQKSRVKEIKNSIISKKTQLKTIEERVKELDKEGVCQVCAEDYDDKERIPVFMKCCSQHFCTACLFQYQRNPLCQFCRAPVKGKDSYTVLSRKLPKKLNENTKVFATLDKIETLAILLKIIKSIERNPSILIFSNYKDTFAKITNAVTKTKLTYERLDGRAEEIKNVLINYNKKELNVLMLDATHYGMGLNLQICNYLILFHRLSKEMEEQVIARANRYGRNTPLKIFYLINSETESDKTTLTENPYLLLSTDDEWIVRDPPEIKQDKPFKIKEEKDLNKIEPLVPEIKVEDNDISESEESDNSGGSDGSDDSESESEEESKPKKKVKLKPKKKQKKEKVSSDEEVSDEEQLEDSEDSPTEKVSKKTNLKGKVKNKSKK
jgi:hypothetical protein